MTFHPKAPSIGERKTCIFCGGVPLSQEHIWPQWAQSLLPTSPRHIRATYTKSPTQPLTLKKQTRRQGSVRTVKVRRVCVSCNSGWMSLAEQGLQPVLEQMISGMPTPLQAATRRTLAEYLTYKLLILDWGENDPVIPPGAAREFLASRAIPPMISIDLFNCFEGRWRTGMRAYATCVAPVGSEIREDAPANVKSITVGIGNLLVFAILAHDVDPQIEFTDGASSVRLWPDPGGVWFWPPRFPIDTERADQIAGTLDHIREMASRSDI